VLFLGNFIFIFSTFDILKFIKSRWQIAAGAGEGRRWWRGEVDGEGALGTDSGQWAEGTEDEMGREKGEPGMGGKKSGG
jgi:hypothetical protein